MLRRIRLRRAAATTPLHWPAGMRLRALHFLTVLGFAPTSFASALGEGQREITDA